MFEKSLIDLIRGLRHFKGAESDYVESCLQECRKEVKDSNPGIKSNALLKLVYLEMFGHDMAWAAFNVLEVMSSTTIADKRIGYLAAVQTFRPRTDVLLMMTNMLKKDLTSPILDSIILPLVVLPHVANASLASAVAGDVLSRISHSNPDICKKAVASLFSLTMAQSDLMQISWPKTIEALMDNSLNRDNQSVSAALTNVICELSLRRPQDCLILAPRLFDLLVQSENNWMLIKIIKTFAKLTATEPRLAGKLLPPLLSLVHTSPAMSVLYECIHAILHNNLLATYDSNQIPQVVDLCVEKLIAMITTTEDPNLRFVALGTLDKILCTYPAYVKRHDTAIIQCIQDTDNSIKIQVLSLLPKLVDSNNLRDIITELLNQLRRQNTDRNPRSRSTPGDLETGKLTIMLADTVIGCCRLNDYSYIGDFEWYIDILVQLLYIFRNAAEDMLQFQTLEEVQNALESLEYRLASEIAVLASRLVELRPKIVSNACAILQSVDQRTFSRRGASRDILASALVRIIGEQASLIVAPEEQLDMLLRLGSSASPALLSSLILSISRLGFELMLEDLRTGKWSSLTSQLLGARISEFLNELNTNESIETQERASGVLEMFRLINESMSDVNHYPPLSEGFLNAMSSLFEPQALNAIADGAQSRIPDASRPVVNDVLNQGIASILSAAGADAPEVTSLRHAEMFYYGTDMTLDFGLRDPADMHPETQKEGSMKASSETVFVEEDKRPIDVSHHRLTKAGLEVSLKAQQRTSESPLAAARMPARLRSTEGSTQAARSGDGSPKEPRYVLAPLDDVATSEGTRSTSLKDEISPATRSNQTVEARRAASVVSSQDQHSVQTRRGSLTYERNLNPDSSEMLEALADVNKKRLEMQRDADRINVSTETGHEGIKIIKKPRAKKRNIAKP